MVEFGFNWEFQSSGTSERITSIFFPDENIGYCAGYSYLEGFVLKTNNGGNTWSIIKTIPDHWLYSVFFTDESTGYVAGGHGVILKTTNGGLTFTQSYNSDENVVDIFPNPTSGNITIKHHDQQNKNQIVFLYNSNGQKIREFNGQRLNSIQFDISDFNAGIYFIKIQTSNNTIIRKVLKL